MTNKFTIARTNKETIATLLENEYVEKNFKPNGVVIVVGTGSSIEINGALAVSSIGNISRTIENIRTADNDSKTFFKVLAGVTESIMNCYSMKEREFTGLQDFDKSELRRKLQYLSEIL